MKNKKDLIEIILLGTIAILLFVGLIFIAIHFKKSENLEDFRKQEQTNVEKEVENNSFPKEEQSSPEPTETNPQEPEKTTIPKSTINPTSKPSPTPIPTQEPVKNEENVLSYFETLSTSVATYQDENDPSFREKAKNAFTTVVDFLFYDSTIHGYTFKELTTTAKLKVIKIALKIDNKIDSYFPNYKTTIKSKMQDIKGKAALLYLETTSKLCETVGESACNEARVDFKNMKESFGLTWDIIKSAASSSYKSLKTILNEWYQSIK